MALNNYPHAKKVEYDDETETVYYTEQALPEKENWRLYNNIDWLALAKDKIALYRVADNFIAAGKLAERAGLLRVGAVINAMQNDAQDRGYPVVWPTRAEQWAQIERDQNKTRAVFEKAGAELFEALKTVVDSSGGAGGPEQREYRVVSDKAIAAARELLKRLEANDGSPSK